MQDIGVGYVSTPKVASNSIRRLNRQSQAKVLFDYDEDIKKDREFKAKMDREISL